ncbi:MAG: ATP-grasp domain-containing protein [Granulosicoccus sp.]
MNSERDSRTVLLTLGRLPVALELARALHGGGWRVLVAEPYAWHLCRLSNSVHRSFKVTAPAVNEQLYLDELQVIIEREQVSLVLPVSEEILYVSALKHRLPPSVELLCMDQRTLALLQDKYCFARFADKLGLPVPATVLADNESACRQLTTLPFVVKPRQSCAGAGVRFGTAGGALENSELSDTHVVQQQLSGIACCSFTLATTGQTLTSVCYGSLLEAGSVAVCFEQMAVPESISEFINRIVQATEYSGMIAFDFIQDDTGVWRAIECNPRSTSGIHFIEHDDLLKGLIRKLPFPSPVKPVRRQEFWSSLMQVEGALFKGKINASGWKNLFTSKDITLRFPDIKPFVFMVFILAPQLFQSIKTRKPMSELLMSDMVWRGNLP